LQTLPDYKTKGSVVVVINAEAAISAGHEFWVTQSKAVVTRAPIPDYFIVHILRADAADPLSDPLCCNKRALQAADPARQKKNKIRQQEIEAERRDFAQGGPGHKERPPAIKLKPRWQPIVLHERRAHFSEDEDEPSATAAASASSGVWDEWSKFRLDNSIARLPHPDLQVRRSMNVDDIDPNWCLRWGEVFLGRVINDNWVALHEKAFLPVSVGGFDVIFPADEHNDEVPGGPWRLKKLKIHFRKL